MTRRDGALTALWAAALGAWVLPGFLQWSRALYNFGDLYTYHYPLRHLVASTLQAGRLPFWNPYIFGGLPLAANPQTVLFYPVAVLGRLLPTLPALTLDAGLHLFWAGLGVVLLARQAGLRSSESWVLGVVYALSPMLVYRVTEGIPTLLAALAWVPWCWLAWLSGRRGFLGLVWALQLLCGHQQFLVINAAAMFLARPASFLDFLREGLIALALTAVQWLPTWEFLGQSVRKGWPLSYSLGYSVDARTLLTLVDPAVWGDAVAKTYAGPPSVFFETSCAYMGALVPALAVIGLWRGPRRVPLTLAALGLFFAFGAHNPLYAKLLKDTPLGFLRTPSRWLLALDLGLLFAAGAALKKLRRGPGTVWARAALGVALIAELFVWDRRFLRSEDAWLYVRSSSTLPQQVGDAPFRIMTDVALANPNKTMLYRAMNVNGYEAFYLGRFPLYAARSEGGPAADASRSYLGKLATPEMRRLAVAYKLLADGSFGRDPGHLPLAYPADGGSPLPVTLSLERPRPELWRAAGVWPSGADRLVLSQPLYPGWRALWNGRPVRLELWDGFLQAARAPASQKAGEPFVVEAGYAPTGWPLWAAFTALAWLSLLDAARRAA